MVSILGLLIDCPRIYQNKKIEKFHGYSKVRTEVPYGRENSRIDILLESAGLRDCFIEVKMSA